MTANGAAEEPIPNARVLRVRQHASFNVPAFRACKGSDGHIGSHIDEIVGTHDKQPFFRVVKAARQSMPRQRSGGQQSEGDWRSYDVSHELSLKNDSNDEVRPIQAADSTNEAKAQRKAVGSVGAPQAVSCELKYHGEFGVEAQIFEDGWLFIGRRFDT